MTIEEMIDNLIKSGKIKSYDKNVHCYVTFLPSTEYVTINFKIYDDNEVKK